MLDITFPNSNWFTISLKLHKCVTISLNGHIKNVGKRVRFSVLAKNKKLEKKNRQIFLHFRKAREATATELALS